jgi:hypothetical protein
VYKCFAGASYVRTDLNFLSHLDLWPERVEMEAAKSAVIIITKCVERKLMGKIKGWWKYMWGL